MRALVLLLGTLLVLLSGCAEPTRPIALEVAVVQGRDDRASRVVAVRVTNGGDELDLTRVELSGGQFDGPATWSRGTTLRAGATVDVRVELPGPVCPTPAGATPMVRLEFTTVDGRTGSIEAVPDQPADALTLIAAEDCVLSTLERHATVTLDALDWTTGTGDPARLTFRVDPTGADGSVELVQLSGTVLLGLVDGGGIVESVPLAVTVGASSAASTFSVEVVPNRCDPHAVAEDKRGTFFPLLVRGDDDVEGVVSIAAGDQYRAELYRFVGDYCAAP